MGLGLGESSLYRLNVDGIPGKTFEDVVIRAKDSIFVFVETTVDIEEFSATANQFLYTDQIQFDTGANQQNVELVTLVQDAVFLFPERDANGVVETLNLGVDADGQPVLIEGFILDDDELTFTNEGTGVGVGPSVVLALPA